MKVKSIGLILIALISVNGFGISEAGTLDVQTVVRKMVEKVQMNVLANSEYGSYQKVSMIKLGEKGTSKDQQVKIYHTVWINGKPFSELIRVNSRDLSRTDRANESKRRATFIKAIQSSPREQGLTNEVKNVLWWKLYKNYNFKFVPAERTAAYALSFEPKAMQLRETSRVEKILNRLRGKIWLDSDFNVLRGEAVLANPIKFGWGILGKVQEIQIHYEQQPFDQIWMPAFLQVKYRAQIALFHTEAAALHVAWYQPYHQTNRSGAVATQIAKEKPEVTAEAQK